MATTNVGRFLQERYRAAISKYGRGKDTHAEALEELSDLLMDDHLSSVHRLKANAALADGVLDWFLAESYRSAAELIFTNIRDSIPIIPGAPIEGEIAFLRDLLDSLAAEQQRDNPRQLQKPLEQSSTRHDAIATLTYSEPAVELADQPTPILQRPQAIELPIRGSPSHGSPKSAAMADTQTTSDEASAPPTGLPSHSDPTVTRIGK